MKPMRRSSVHNESVAALRHRVRALEAREEDVLLTAWRYDNKLANLEGVVEQVNAATLLNQETEAALKRAEEAIVGREAELMARERACLDRDAASRRREAASAMLDAEEATRLIEAAVDWVRKYMQEGDTDHLCEVLAAGEEAGHCSFALSFALTEYAVSVCDCQEEIDGD